MTNLSIQPGNNAQGTVRPIFTLGDYVAFCWQGSLRTTHVGRISRVTPNFHFEIEGKRYTGSGWAPQTWTAGAADLRYMTFSEMQSIMPDHLYNIMVQADGTVRQVLYVNIDDALANPVTPQPTVEDRIGLRHEEIDWNAHRDFMRGL